MSMKEETHGARRRREIVAVAADLSTVEGLESLSFSRIADEVGLTKAGVAAHFESKEALQLAVVDAAASSYVTSLVAAGSAAEPGLHRLAALAGAWLEHLESIEYRGGCFFAAAGQAFAGRPGPVRDAVARHTRRLLQELNEQAHLAKRLGELAADIAPETLAFQIHALALEANLHRELLDEGNAFTHARHALDQLLSTAAESE
jgi:AcrR family transcriptional regulator